MTQGRASAPRPRGSEQVTDIGSSHAFVIRDNLRHGLALAMAAQAGEGPWLLFLQRLRRGTASRLRSEIYRSHFADGENRYREGK